LYKLSVKLTLPSGRAGKQNKKKPTKQKLSRNKKLGENKAASNLHGPTEQDLDLDLDLGPDSNPDPRGLDPRPNNSFKVATLFAHLPLKFNARHLVGSWKETEQAQFGK